MGYIHFNEQGWLVDRKGEPFFVVGINYVASYVCTNFLEDFRQDILEKDLAQIEAMGLNAVRIPIYWGCAEPEEGVFNERLFQNLDTFIAMAKKHNLYVMPWFLVGIATASADIPYRQGRPIFEGDMLFAAENHLRTFARRYKNEEAILFWDICDEPEFYARLSGNVEKWPYNTKRFNHWLKHMYEAFKTEDPNHLVTLGYGHICTENYGYNLLDSAQILDIMSITCYPYDSAIEGLDTARNNYFMGFFAKMHDIKNKPVFACEAPGFTSVKYSEAMLGRYFRTSIYSSLLNGITGVMPWVYNDFEKALWEGRTLNTDPAEPSFGIVDNNGRIKPSGQALVDFGKFVRDVKITDYTRRKGKVAVYVPDHYFNQNIFHSQRKLRAAMQFVKGCGADIQYVWDSDDLSGYEMVIMFATSCRIAAWRKLAEYVEAGGNLLYCYDGDCGLTPYFNGLFGVETQTRQKNFDFDKVILKQTIGELEAGRELLFPESIKDERLWMSGGYNLQSATGFCSEYLIVEPKGAEVMAVFPDDTPAILKHSYGEGRAWFLAGQFQNALFEMKYCNYQNHMMFPLCNGIMTETGITRPCRYVNSELEVGLFEKENGEKMLILVNHAPKENRVELTLSAELAKMRVHAWEDREGVIAENGKITLAMQAAEVVKLMLS